VVNDARGMSLRLDLQQDKADRQAQLLESFILKNTVPTTSMVPQVRNSNG